MSITVGVNSWVTLTEANNYLNYKWDADEWATLTVAEREKLLVSAFYLIRNNTKWNIVLTDSSDIVKNAQIELAWYIYSNWDEISKRQALISSGVTSFSISKFSESLKSEIEMIPQFIQNMLNDSYTGSSNFSLMYRELDE